MYIYSSQRRRCKAAEMHSNHHRKWRLFTSLQTIQVHLREGDCHVSLDFFLNYWKIISQYFSFVLSLFLPVKLAPYTCTSVLGFRRKKISFYMTGHPTLCTVLFHFTCLVLARLSRINSFGKVFFIETLYRNETYLH